MQVHELPADVFELEVSRRNVGHKSHCKAQLVRNIPTGRTNLLRDLPNILEEMELVRDAQTAHWEATYPSLHHAHDPDHDPQKERCETRDSNWQSPRIVPALEIVVGKLSSPEEVVLSEDYNGI